MKFKSIIIFGVIIFGVLAYYWYAKNIQLTDEQQAILYYKQAQKFYGLSSWGMKPSDKKKINTAKRSLYLYKEVYDLKSNHPDSWIILYDMELVYAFLGDYDNTLKIMNRLVENEALSDFTERFAYEISYIKKEIEKGLSAAEQIKLYSKYDDVFLKRIKERLKKEPDNAELCKLLGDTYKNRNIDKTIFLYDKAIERWPDNYSYYYAKANVLYSHKKYEAAIAYIDSISSKINNKFFVFWTKSNLDFLKARCYGELGKKQSADEVSDERRKEFKKLWNEFFKKCSIKKFYSSRDKIPKIKENFLSYFVKDHRLYENYYKNFKDNIDEEYFLESRLKETADNNDIESILHLSKFYKKKKEYVKAFTYIEKAAELGDADAQADVGDAYYSGEKFVKKDLKKAFKWYSKAAEQENSFAQYRLGFMYLNGHGTDVDLIKAYTWTVLSDNSFLSDIFKERYSKPVISELEKKMSTQDIETAKEKAAEWRKKSVKEIEDLFQS